MYDRMCYQTVRYCFLLVSVWMGASRATPPACAETESRRRVQADEYIREALHNEIDAATAERQRLLARALELAPEYPAARWQNGYVRYFNRWVAADSVPQIAKLQNRLDMYEIQRDRTPKSASGRLALADWCAKNDFPLQERAHLSEVLQQRPDHAGVRNRLGFVRVGGRWVEEDDFWSGVRQLASSQADLRKWSPRLSAMAKKLRSRDEATRAEGKEALLSLTDVSAIPALERLAGTEERCARVVTRVLGRMPYPQASAALARLGVFLPWRNARYQAALELRRHPADNYIPGLLAEMATPITSRIRSLQSNGRLLYRQVFVREMQSQTQTAVVDTVFQPEYVVLGDGDVVGADFAAGFDDLLGQVLEMAAGREQQRQTQNQLMAAINRRIFHVLQFATGKLLAEDPRVWWAWWDQENQTQRRGAKLDNEIYRQQTRAYFVPVYTGPGEEDSVGSQLGGIQVGGVQLGGLQPRGSRHGNSPTAPSRQVRRAPRTARRPDGSPVRPPGVYDCFVAGTPVWTARGRMKIELVAPGDLVLSQDANTGELDYKPVLQAVRRSPEPLVKVLTGDESLEASGGHALWVNGKGWVLVRELESGMVLHGADGSIVVRDVLPGSHQATYNLVVADFHTYFAGHGRVFSHDNTSRRPTGAQVPGLAKSMD